MRTRHVVVFEPESNGHQMFYVRYLLDGIRARVPDCRVTLLTTGAAAEHPTTQELVQDFSGFVTPRIAPDVPEGNRFWHALGGYYEYLWRHGESLSRGLREIGPDDVDFVVLPYFETIGLMNIALNRGLLHGRPWATISHNIHFHHRACGIEAPFEAIGLLHRALLWRVLRDPTLRCFGSNDPYLPGYVGNPKVVYCPHPAVGPELSSVEAARAAYGIRPETTVILVFGVINRVKCVDLLLEAAARIVPETDVTVLLAGAQSDDALLPILQGEAAAKLRSCGSLVEVNRFIVTGQDIDPMSAADIVWVFYRPEFYGNSDVLCRAALSRLPVIVRRRGLPGRLVEDHELGLALTSDAPDDIAAALRRLVADPALRQRMGENGARAFAGYTPEKLAEPIVDAISHGLRGSQPSLIDDNSPPIASASTGGKQVGR